MCEVRPLAAGSKCAMGDSISTIKEKEDDATVGSMARQERSCGRGMVDALSLASCVGGMGQYGWQEP